MLLRAHRQAAYDELHLVRGGCCSTLNIPSRDVATPPCAALPNWPCIACTQNLVAVYQMCMTGGLPPWASRQRCACLGNDVHAWVTLHLISLRAWHKSLKHVMAQVSEARRGCAFMDVMLSNVIPQWQRQQVCPALLSCFCSLRMHRHQYPSQVSGSHALVFNTNV